MTGLEFYGQLLDLPDTSRVSNFLSARRYLRTSPNVPLNYSDVAIIDKKKYILADHGVGFYAEPIYQHFKMFEVDAEEDYTPFGIEEDEVTGAKRRIDDESNIQTVYLSIQPKSSISDTIHIPTFTRVCICNLDIPVDSKVGEFQVTKNDKMLGVYLLEMKRL